MRYDSSQPTPDLADFLTSPDAREIVMAAAEAGADVAKSYVSVESGELRDSIRAEFYASRGGAKGDRAEAWVLADSDHAAAVEFGNKRTKARPFLAPVIAVIEGGA